MSKTTPTNGTNSTATNVICTSDQHRKHYEVIGNIVNATVLVSSLVYAVAVVYLQFQSHHHALDKQDNNNNTTVVVILDKQWKQDGFCIQNKDIPYWSSFDTCLYVDVIFSLALLAMYILWKNHDGMKKSSEIVPMVIVSTIGHGLAHGVMATKFRKVMTIVKNKSTTMMMTMQSKFHHGGN